MTSDEQAEADAVIAAYWRQRARADQPTPRHVPTPGTPGYPEWVRWKEETAERRQEMDR